MPDAVGGYPVNYGFVPQTVSYDGDPFDVLVLGPPIAGGSIVRGVIVGLMFMEDEKGLDSKVVVSRPGRDGRPLHALTPSEQGRIGRYFAVYKQHETGKYSKVPGWGSVEEGRAHVTTTHAFFLHCRQQAGQPCRIPAAPVVVALIAATSAPAGPSSRRRRPLQPPSATARGRSGTRRGTPAATSADFHVSDNATAALAEAMHWLRITAPAPYPQRSVAVPVPVTMSSQLMTCSPRAAVHSELQMKGLSLSCSRREEELSDMPELKSTSCATDGASGTSLLRRQLSCFAAIADRTVPSRVRTRTPMLGTPVHTRRRSKRSHMPASHRLGSCTSGR